MKISDTNIRDKGREKQHRTFQKNLQRVKSFHWGPTKEANLSWTANYSFMQMEDNLAFTAYTLRNSWKGAEMKKHPSVWLSLLLNKKKKICFRIISQSQCLIAPRDTASNMT